MDLTNSPSKKSTRRWYQIRLRTMLFGFLALFTIGSMVVKPIFDQYIAIKWVHDNGGSVRLDSKRSTWAIFRNVNKVCFPNGSKLKNLEHLRNFSELTVLEINYSDVEDYSGLRNLKKLEVLDLTGSNIKNLSPLEKLKELQILSLKRTKITDLRPLSKFSYLKILEIGDTRISDLSAILHLPVLCKLEIDHTGVSSLSNLTEMKSLGRLVAYGCQISQEDVSYLLRERKGLTITVSVDTGRIEVYTTGKK